MKELDVFENWPFKVPNMEKVGVKQKEMTEALKNAESEEEALKIIKHFAGVISPDFSTYYDFPKHIKGFNIYRMRAFDCYMELESVPYIHNVRWGTEETWNYCFDGIPKGSTVAIGTIASGLRKKENRKLFDAGFRKMIDTLQPKAIIIYGSENYAVIQEAKNKGILIISFESKTNLAFKQRGRKQP